MAKLQLHPPAPARQCARPGARPPAPHYLVGGCLARSAPDVQRDRFLKERARPWPSPGGVWGGQRPQPLVQRWETPWHSGNGGKPRAFHGFHGDRECFPRRNGPPGTALDAPPRRGQRRSFRGFVGFGGASKRVPQTWQSPADRPRAIAPRTAWPGPGAVPQGGRTAWPAPGAASSPARTAWPGPGAVPQRKRISWLVKNPPSFPKAWRVRCLCVVDSFHFQQSDLFLQCLYFFF